MKWNGSQLADRLVLPGRVADVEPWPRRRRVVLPSYQEGLSVALLEALALGMPAIASDIAANRGLLPAADLPLFTPRNPAALAEAMAQRLAAPQDDRMTERRNVIIKRFSLEVVAKAHLQLFERIVAS